MIFKIIWDKKAKEYLEKLDFKLARRIILKVKSLSEDPFSKDIKRLQDEHTFRMRIGDYRVIFDIIRDAIIILKIGHRKNIYD